MCRNRVDADERIHKKCALAMTDEKAMAELGEKLLAVFHEVCSGNTLKANDVTNELCYYAGEVYDPSEETKLMDQALIRLEYFVEDSERDRYDREIKSILQTGNMIRIMDALKCKLYNYGKAGPEYVSVISTYYMNAFEYTNEEASEILNMSLSTFYRRKRRAVILFGLAFLEYKAEILGYDPMYMADPDGSQISMGMML